MMGISRLLMTGIDKRFGLTQALSSVDLRVSPGEVHGLLGGNGAGKTTLMNVLYGLYRADKGLIEIDGEPVDISSPGDAIAAGVGMVHQSFLQIDSYTALENVVLGDNKLGGLRLDLGPARARIMELSEKFGLAVDPDTIVEQLPVGVRQRVEILKALYQGSKILILDEPTTNLTPQEVDALFGSMRAMVDSGMSVILITHKIRETMAVCDRMTVMRDGSKIQTFDCGETGPEELAATMVGQDPEAAAIVDPRSAPSGPGSERKYVRTDLTVEAGVVATGLGIANDHGHQLFQDFSFDIGAGEIVGIAGVAGNGQVELAEALSGVRPVRSGTVRIAGGDLTTKRTAEWLSYGVAYVPEDRSRDGILPRSSITDNLMLGSQRDVDVKTAGLIDWKRARERATEVIERFSIRASGPAALAGDLSGGNIQRVILARAFAHQPRLLVLHNPTRGLDMGSTQFVYEQVRQAAMDGCAVLLLSEDLDEVLSLSDRVLALYSGRCTGEWDAGKADPYEVGRCMTGLVQAK